MNLDLLLTLTDTIRDESVLVHKNILSKKSPFFEKLFTNFKEKDQDKITIQVPDIQATHDIIMNFYGQTLNPDKLSEYSYLIKLIKCYDYLGISVNASLIKGLKVSKEDFDLLLDVVDLIGFDEETIKIISDNLPEDYDISKFPKELVDEMIRINTSYQIISGGRDKKINIWDASTGDLLKTLEEHNNWIQCVCYSRDNRFFASCSTGSDIIIRDTCTWNLIKIIPMFGKTVYSVDFSPDGQRIVCGCHNNSVKIWDIISTKFIHTLRGNDNMNGSVRYSAIKSVCYSPDNQRVVSGSADSTIKIWDAINGTLIKTLNGHVNGVNCVIYSPDNKQIVSGGSDRTIKIWNAVDGNLIRILGDYIYNIRCVCYSPDSQRIISGSLDAVVKIWDALTGNLIKTLKGHTLPINSVSYSSDNQIIVSGSADTLIKIWNASTGDLIRTIDGPRMALQEHTNDVNSIAVATNINNKFIKMLAKN